MKASEITLAAASLVGGDRARTHGDKTLNHDAIAAVWNGIMSAAGKSPKHPLDAHDVANLMEGMKIARRYTGSFNVDDYIDGSGYAAVAGEIKAEQVRRDQTWADAAVADAATEGCPAGDLGKASPTFISVQGKLSAEDAERLRSEWQRSGCDLLASIPTRPDLASSDDICAALRELIDRASGSVKATEAS